LKRTSKIKEKLLTRFVLLQPLGGGWAWSGLALLVCEALACVSGKPNVPNELAKIIF